MPYEHPCNPIGYLVQRRFGDALKTVTSQEEQTRLSGGMGAYRAELQSLSLDDVNSRVNEELTREARAQDEKDKAAFAYWSQLPSWTVEEAAALTLRMNPESATCASAKLPSRSS
jgi:hypothetical protein